MEYGYVRVSTKEQNEDRQMIAMKNWLFRNYPFNGILSSSLVHQFCSKKFYPTPTIHGSFYHL